jgi:hypothetical protein
VVGGTLSQRIISYGYIIDLYNKHIAGNTFLCDMVSISLNKKLDKINLPPKYNTFQNNEVNFRYLQCDINHLEQFRTNMQVLCEWKNKNSELFTQSQFNIREASRLYSIVYQVDKQLFVLLSLLICKYPLAARICDIRRKEGLYINSTLKNLREAINNILYSSTQGNVLNPPFVDVCLKDYCSEKACFINKPTYINVKENVIGDVITSSVKSLLNALSKSRNQEISTFKFEDIIIAIFCVMNISHSASNPPPTPYININDLKRVCVGLQSMGSQFLTDNITNFSTLLNAIIDFEDKVIYFGDKTVGIKNSDSFKKLMDLKKSLLKNITFTYQDDNTTLPVWKLITNQEEDLCRNALQIDSVKRVLSSTQGYLRNVIEDIDVFNASSTIGTLEFVDSLSKYYTTSLLCEYPTNQTEDGYHEISEDKDYDKSQVFNMLDNAFKKMIINNSIVL